MKAPDGMEDLPSARALVGRRATVFLPGGNERSVPTARTWLRNTLEVWQVPGAAADDLELIISELVTNAVVHTTSRRLFLRLGYRPGLVWISVLDQGPRTGAIRPSPAPSDGLGGRGLLLVEQCAHRWGERPVGQGSWVWATVRVKEPDER